MKIIGALATCAHALVVKPPVVNVTVNVNIGHAKQSRIPTLTQHVVGDIGEPESLIFALFKGGVEILRDARAETKKSERRSS